MTKIWQKVSSKIVYENKWLKFFVDQVIRPDNSPGIYSYLSKSVGIFVVAQDSDKSIYIIKQHRYPVNGFVYELPAGSVEPGMTNLQTAKKELKEETGITAKNWQKLGQYFVAPGHESCQIVAYLATNLDITKLSKSNQEGDESISKIIKLSPQKLKTYITSGKINCGISLAALNLYLLKSI